MLIDPKNRRLYIAPAVILAVVLLIEHLLTR